MRREKIPYAIKRYGDETDRLYGVLDGAARPHRRMVAGDYSIADMASFPWVVTHKAQQVDMDKFPNVKRWFSTMRVRPGVERGMAVGKDWRGKTSKGMSDDAKKVLFGQTAASVQR